MNSLLSTCRKFCLVPSNEVDSHTDVVDILCHTSVGRVAVVKFDGFSYYMLLSMKAEIVELTMDTLVTQPCDCFRSC